MSSPPPDSQLVCSFCARSQREVRKLIAGPSVYICDACITLCWELMERSDSPPRIPSPATTPFGRRDAVVVEVYRALEAAFPDRAQSLIHDLEQLLPAGGPLICQDCRGRPEALPSPCPEDFVCPDWRIETWTAQGYRPTENTPETVAAWPWLQVLRRENAANPGQVEFVLLAPLILRRPIVLSARG